MHRRDVLSDTELTDVARLFFGDEIPQAFVYENDDKYNVEIYDKRYEFDYGSVVYSCIPPSRRSDRLCKIALYDALCALTGKNMVWGALTGVRPTKLFYEAIDRGMSMDEARRMMSDVYRVGKSRADILARIIDMQNGKLKFAPEYVNLYVHIPYCPTRCNYCSFVSLPIDKYKEQSNSYTAYLCEDIKKTMDFLKDSGRKILSVYIGGGTPTALSDDNFCTVLDALGAFDCEYTCEAGRPDTLSENKARIMKEHGVTRVCVNPQTLNDATLERIGRRHTSGDFFRAIDTAQSFGFDINCDLIAGLDGETANDFTVSYEGVKRLRPHNITVHSLSKKNGSEIRFDPSENTSAAAMTDYAFSHTDGYAPYYLYRQKRQACNLENVGFSVKGKECVNNITTMEETVGVVACGAGAISKYVGASGIARFANIRDVKLYMERFDEKLNDKIMFFSEKFASDKNN